MYTLVFCLLVALYEVERKRKWDKKEEDDHKQEGKTCGMANTCLLPFSSSSSRAVSDAGVCE